MANIAADSANSNVAAVSGRHATSGRGVEGYSVQGVGVWGESKTQSGVTGHSESFAGVWGECKSGPGVHGGSEDQAGVRGVSAKFVGVWGESSGDHPGVLGKGASNVGVLGTSDAFVGVLGESKGTHPGVLGKSTRWQGVHGESEDQAGVAGYSKSFAGVWAETQSANHAALIARGPRLAAKFDGDVEVTGDVRLVNADCAEHFDAQPRDCAPGTVMVMGPGGQLEACTRRYDRAVAGVVSGAGAYRPALLLDNIETDRHRVPIALLGKVACRVDAEKGPVRVGDLLTTSDTVGCAMRVDDPALALGSVIGKALEPLDRGQGLVTILVALQ